MATNSRSPAHAALKTATRSAQIGSIGVLSAHVDRSKMLEALGIKVEVFRNKEAELKAERIVSQAQVRATKLENSIAELKIMKGQLRQKIRGALELVENVLRVQDEEDAADDKLRVLRRSDSETADQEGNEP